MLNPGNSPPKRKQEQIGKADIRTYWQRAIEAQKTKTNPKRNTKTHKPQTQTCQNNLGRRCSGWMGMEGLGDVGGFRLGLPSMVQITVERCSRLLATCSEDSCLWLANDLAMGQNPKPGYPQWLHPNPTTKIGSTMGGEFTHQPKWDPKTVLTRHFGSAWLELSMARMVGIPWLGGDPISSKALLSNERKTQKGWSSSRQGCRKVCVEHQPRRQSTTTTSLGTSQELKAPNPNLEKMMAI